MRKILLALSLLIVFAGFSFSAEAQSYKVAKLKYDGGGDWYSNETALPNLIDFCNSNFDMTINSEQAVVEVGSPELFTYPFVHMTGHGNVAFSPQEADNLRNYLISGGFLHIDDNYGMDKFIRTEMKKVFPEAEFIELPFSHEIYKIKYAFSEGLPKVHEHDGKAPQGFGIIHEGRLVCFYSYESDLGDGWEDPEVHKDPEELRLAALRMGANILLYALTQYD